MKLSIIVPVFNMASGGKLEYCLESLVNQTINDYEIIAVDDCSTDNSLEILHQYETKYPDKFKVIASPVNKKQGGAKNLGLEIAKGDWIGFIDSDDWIHIQTVEKLYNAAIENKVFVSTCNYQTTNGENPAVDISVSAELLFIISTLFYFHISNITSTTRNTNFQCHSFSIF